MGAICHRSTPVSGQISRGAVSTYLGRYTEMASRAIASSTVAYNPPDLPQPPGPSTTRCSGKIRLVSLPCVHSALPPVSHRYVFTPPVPSTGAFVQREEANAAVDAAIVSLFIPQADGLAFSAEPVGTDAQGHTTWILGPGVVSGTLTPPPLTPFPTGAPLPRPLWVPPLCIC